MSDFRFACPNCGQKFSADTAYTGTPITCASCQKPFAVPAPPPKGAAKPSALNIPGQSFGKGRKDRIPADVDTRKISGYAIASLVCCLFLSVGCIPGILCGHLSRRRLRRDPTLAGVRLAKAGLIVNYSLLAATLAALAVGLAVFYSRQGHQLSAKESAANTPEVMAARRVDEVSPGELSSEAAHKMRAERGLIGTFFGRSWRAADRGGFFSYDMKVNPVEPMSLHCTYWGNDSGGRRFDILVNDEVIATQELDFNDPGRFFDVEYKIPRKLTRGRNEVTVVFRAYPGNYAGGIFGCQMLKR